MAPDFSEDFVVDCGDEFSLPITLLKAGSLASIYPGVSLFTIFRLFTGDGWSEIPIQIAENSSEFMGRLVRTTFAVLFFLGGILGLSFVNSIFVDAMTGDNNDEVLRRLEELEKKIDNLSRESAEKSPSSE